MTPQPNPPPPDIDLNQVVAYNIREARQLRGWTQEELADRLEPYLGQRLTQAGVSSIERAWDGERRREFDAHELLIFAMVFDLPILWFLLPPPGDHRVMRSTTRPVDELYAWLLGQPQQLEPLYQRLRQLGITDPTTAERTVEKITGVPAAAKQWSYRERRKELLLALRTIAVLRSWRRRQLETYMQTGVRTDDSGFVFARPDGNPLHPDYFSQTFERLIAKMDLPRLELTEIGYTLGSPSRGGEPMTEREQQRLVNHRLAIIRHVEEVTGNVAQTWRDKAPVKKFSDQGLRS